ncbi:hypothetical protein C0Z01_18455 [Photobacterium kishitanii]|nr:hypothetical protein C0W35_21585 [Photobacterium kishitanii]PSW67836.1 hypothetical protein C0Z01_18455 [Photobacterium kishitanii]
MILPKIILITNSFIFLFREFMTRIKNTHLACLLLTSISFSTFASVDDINNKPQFVVISLDDGVNQEMEKSVAQLNSTVPLTFYVNVVQQAGGWVYEESMLDIVCVNDDGLTTGDPQCVSNPKSINNLYKKGHEFALHTYSHPAIASGNQGEPLTQAQIEKELKKNYEFLVASGIPGDKIKGFRAPFLDTNSSGWDRENKNAALGHLQGIMNQLNISYDSSLSAAPEQTQPRKGVRHCTSIPGGWDNVHCDFSQKEQFNWEDGGYPKYTVATQPKSNQLFMGYKYIDGSIVNVMDTVFGACNQTCTPEQAKNIWMENFLNHYKDASRPPFGIYLHRQSLSISDEVDGLNAFIKEVQLEYPNTYFVTASQVSDYYKIGVDLTPEQIKAFLSK